MFLLATKSSITVELRHYELNPLYCSYYLYSNIIIKAAVHPWWCSLNAIDVIEVEWKAKIKMYRCWLSGWCCPQWQAYKKAKKRRKRKRKKKKRFCNKRSHMAVFHIWQIKISYKLVFRVKMALLVTSSQIRSDSSNYNKLIFFCIN